MKVRVRDAESDDDLGEVRRLFREFVVWHRARQAQNVGLLAAYFDDAGWQAERQLDAESCEMKRMYVDGAGRGQAVGTALGEAVIQRAGDLDYSAIHLDTSIEQHEAIALYRSLGFEEVEPYYAVPDAMRDWLVLFRLDLD